MDYLTKPTGASHLHSTGSFFQGEVDKRRTKRVCKVLKSSYKPFKILNECSLGNLLFLVSHILSVFQLTAEGSINVLIN